MSKPKGIIRKIDELGRVVLPIEIRKTFNIKSKDPIEMVAVENGVFLSKYIDTCSLCNSEKNLQHFNDKLICKKCIEQISNLHS